MQNKPLLFGLILSCLGIFSFAVLSFASVDLAQTQSGKILLDVQKNGEAWYIHPLTKERYYLGRPDDAFELMRIMGLGISNADLSKIPKASDSWVGDTNLRKQLSGRILLQVESNGEAWYINPDTAKRYFLGRPEDAFAIMRDLGLGVSHELLITIPDGGEVSASTSFDVPFTAQAPFAEWDDLRQQEGCEEASAFMAAAWARQESFSSQDAYKAIIGMSEYQRERYNSFVDTSAQDTVDRIFQEYLGFDRLELRRDISASDIRNELTNGNLVVIPVDGKALRNPHFRNGGPQRHMIVVTGFDWASGNFITNEPGTRHGEDYLYSYETIQNSLRDYLSGTYIPIPEDIGNAMIVVKPD